MRISVVGKGNVGTHLYQALKDKAEVFLVDSRTLENLPDKNDIALICVKDNAIEETASRLKGKTEIMAHTAGSAEMDILGRFSEKYGVVYPLQTFSKGDIIDYGSIPFLIEGSDRNVQKILSKIAGLISDKIVNCDSKQREKIHLASIFACNFTNHLIAIAQQIMHQEGLDVSLINPLINKTIEKLNLMSAKDGQTGPAIRNDREIIEKHLKMLDREPDLKKLYEILSKNIIDFHSEK